MQNPNRFKSVSVLITHYNRSESLLRLLSTFERLNCAFHEIIVSDDCSNEIHLKRLIENQDKYNFQLIISEKNCGLGHNINKGLDAIRSEYALYIQEDFVPQELFVLRLFEAIEIMTEDSSIDIARFYSYRKFPFLKPISQHFSLMEFNLFKWGYEKFYYYSDHPHLKRKTFTQKFGRYLENKNPEQTEYWMMMSFLKNKGKGIYHNNYHELFEHSNSSSEPSTMERINWKRSNNFFIKIIRDFYRTVKFNYDYLSRKKTIITN